MSIAPESTPLVTPGPLVVVDDPEDPRLDLYRDLNDPAVRLRLDADQPVFVVEGRLAVERLLTSEYTVSSLLVDDHQVTTAGDLVTATRARGAPVFVASRAVVADTVGFALHRGVVAVANRPSPADVEQTPRLYRTQMALYRAALQKIYPGKRIACALVWTDGARLMALPEALLDAEIARILAP